MSTINDPWYGSWSLMRQAAAVGAVALATMGALWLPSAHAGQFAGRTAGSCPTDGMGHSCGDIPSVTPGFASLSDYIAIAQHPGPVTPQTECYDVNQSGFVDASDVSYEAQAIRPPYVCPRPACPPPPVGANGSIDLYLDAGGTVPVPSTFPVTALQPVYIYAFARLEGASAGGITGIEAKVVGSNGQLFFQDVEGVVGLSTGGGYLPISVQTPCLTGTSGRLFLETISIFPLVSDPAVSLTLVANPQNWRYECLGPHFVTCEQGAYAPVPLVLGHGVATGTNVTVNPASNVTLTFSQVTTAGQTHASPIPCPDLGSGYTLAPANSPVCYEISTTATYTGPITICLEYDDAGMSAAEEQNLQIMHCSAMNCVSLPRISLDTATNTICATTTSLSPFALAVPNGPTDVARATPSAHTLYQNTPNPFNPQTTIRYDLGASAVVTLGVYDISSRLVRTLQSEALVPAGAHAVTWDGRDDTGRPIPSGVYFYRLQAGGDVYSERMTLLK